MIKEKLLVTGHYADV